VDPTGHDIETVIVSAIVDSGGDPIVAVAEAVVELVADLFGLSLFGAVTPPLPQTPISVSAPNPTQSPAAGGNSTGLPQVQNTAVSANDTGGFVKASYVTANSDATQTAAANYASVGPTDSSQILAANDQTETVVVTGQHLPSSSVIGVPQAAPAIEDIPGYKELGLNKNAPNFHIYHENFGGCWESASNCTPERVFDGLDRYPSPGASGNPVATGDVGNVPGLGKVVYDVNPNDLSVTNITLPGQELYPGVVYQHVLLQDGYLSIETIGVGNGPLGALNTAFAPVVWSYQTMTIFDWVQGWEQFGPWVWPNH
jgi:hypothetical protein